MSTAYQGISWNKFKKKYDIILWIFIVTFLIVSILSNLTLFPKANVSTVIIRSFGLLSIVLIHIILSIGPLTIPVHIDPPIPEHTDPPIPAMLTHPFLEKRMTFRQY